MATGAALALAEAQARGDRPGVEALLDPRYVNIDLRRGVRLRLEGDEAVDLHRLAASLSETRHERTPVAVRGDLLVLTRNRIRFVGSDADVGDAEVVSLALTECSPDGRIVAQTVFDLDDTDRALAALDARFEELERG